MSPRILANERDFGVGVAFLSFIFVAILAFGSAQYQGAPAK
jgi:hypothetical protein